MVLPQGRKKTAERPELTVITKAKKLMEYTFTITNSENRFPKKIRYSLVQKMQDLSMEIVESLYYANDTGTFNEQERALRRRYQKQALTKCNILMALAEFSYNREYINVKSLEYWSGLIRDVRILGASWLKAENARHNKAQDN